MLERYFKRLLIGRQIYTRIGSWWDRKGENEIDIIAENELHDTATFYEVKRKAENIDIKNLRRKQKLSCVRRESLKPIPFHSKGCQ